MNHPTEPDTKAAMKTADILALAQKHGYHYKEAGGVGWDFTDPALTAFAAELARSAAPADPLQGAANWIISGLDGVVVGDIQSRLLIGYNRAKRLYDAAPEAAPTPQAASPEAIPCHTVWHSSRTCQRGTYKCVVTHLATLPATPAAVPIISDEQIDDAWIKVRTGKHALSYHRDFARAILALATRPQGETK